jgi:hypothetical protein
MRSVSTGVPTAPAVPLDPQAAQAWRLVMEGLIQLYREQDAQAAAARGE